MLDRQRLERLTRHFPENGLKVLLENPGNVHDLLQILKVKLIPRIDFRQMRVEPAQFVQRDYRHLESDIVLAAPLRPTGQSRAREVTIFILIEHQSEPDPFMAFRVLEYIVQTYKRQQQARVREHDSLGELRFQPFLPIVLYSGTRTWDRLIPLAELVALGEEFPDKIPAFKPLFLNVGRTSADDLEYRGGPFGLVLRVLQQRRMRLTVFTNVILRAVRELEDQIAESDRDRWLELLSYLEAMIYHERGPDERQRLHEKILDSVTNDRRRQEVFDMSQTAFEFLRDQVTVQSRQQWLIRLLRNRFRKVPDEVVTRIEATAQLDTLDKWFDEASMAKKLSDISFTAGG